MRRRIRRFFEIGGPQRRAFVEAALALLCARVMLAIAGFPRVRRLLTRERASAAHEDDAARARMLARAIVRAANNLPIRTTCLDRALALWWLLRAHGIGGELRAGVRGGKRLEAHAWVEHAGRALYDDEASGYAAFDAPLIH
jgi:hypothetical protein